MLNLVRVGQWLSMRLGLERDERGQSLTEYALLLAAIVGIIVIAVGALSGALTTMIDTAVQALTDAVGGGGGGGG